MSKRALVIGVSASVIAYAISGVAYLGNLYPIGILFSMVGTIFIMLLAIGRTIN